MSPDSSVIRRYIACAFSRSASARTWAVTSWLTPEHRDDAAVLVDLDLAMGIDDLHRALGIRAHRLR